MGHRMNLMIDKSAYIHPCVIIGKNVKIGPNCSIGYEGFEFLRDKNEVPQFIEHKGGVIIEDNVEIQANVTIARAIDENDNTVIGKDSKLDNLVHIGHKCKIGKGNLLAAGTIFSGSVTTGKNNFFGVNSMVIAGCIIGDYNLIGMGSVVVKNIPDHEIWAGNPARKLRDNLMFKGG